ncbi:MAG: NHL repeat-containing protein [Planctomycetota bacterium]|jgi:hypothetical protein
MSYIKKQLIVGIILAGCSLAMGDINLLDTPLFAEAGKAVRVNAYVDGVPDSVALDWSTDQQNGTIAMSQSGANHWSAVLPAQMVQGSVIHYQFKATFTSAAAVTSIDYVLYICPAFIELQPSPMNLKQKVLVKQKWNKDDGLALTVNQEGPVTGPAAITCDDDNIHVLDNGKKRIVSFDHQGKRRATKPVSVPSTLSSDLLIDPTDQSFIVVSQLDNKVHHIRRNGKLKQTRSIEQLRKMTYPSKFSFSAADDSLLAQDLRQQNGLVGVMRKNRSIDPSARQVEKDPTVIYEAQGNKLILGFNSNPKVFAVTFDKPVVCIEEAVMDADGIVWVLYTLEGDWRMRRLARLDTHQDLVQTAETDIWFAFGATRRMALTKNGVVLLAGDLDEARIVKFDYK